MSTTEKKKKNYVKGSAKEVIFANGGSLVHIDILIEDLKRLPVNERGYVKLTLSKLPEADRFGNTHTLYENDFKPNEAGAKGQAAKAGVKAFPKAEFKGAASNDDLPF